MPEGPIEPRATAGAEVEGSAEAPGPGRPLEPLLPLQGRREFARQPPELWEVPRELRAPKRVLPLGQGKHYCLVLL